jgi:hypothetical protein
MSTFYPFFFNSAGSPRGLCGACRGPDLFY